MDYRASVDATVAFTNGGGLTAEGFRIDIPGPDTPDDEIARLFVESLGLLMAGFGTVSVHAFARV